MAIISISVISPTISKYIQCIPECDFTFIYHFYCTLQIDSFQLYISNGLDKADNSQSSIINGRGYEIPTTNDNRDLSQCAKSAGRLYGPGTP